MNDFETLFSRHANPLLDPDEMFEAIAHLSASSGLWTMKNYVAGATSKRLVLVDIFGGPLAPRSDFVGVRDIPYREIESFQTPSFLNVKRILIGLRSGESFNLTLAALGRTAPGQGRFLGVLRSQYESFKLNPADASESGDDSEVVSVHDLQTAREEARQDQRLGVGILVGVVVAVLAAIIWAGITLVTGYQIGWMAIGVGVLVGSAIRFFGRGVETSFGIAGAVLSLFGCVLGDFLWATYVFSQAAHVSLPSTLVIFGRGPALAFEVMLATFNLKDVTFYILASFAGYALSFRKVHSPRPPEADTHV